MSFLDFDDHSRESSFLLSGTTASSANPPRQGRGSDADLRDAVEEEVLLQKFNENPEAAAALIQSYMRAADAPRESMTEITPEPGFVIKVVIAKNGCKIPMDNQKAVTFPKGTFVYLNICSSDKMPKPTVASEAEIQRALREENGAKYEVPVHISPPRQYKDSDFELPHMRSKDELKKRSVILPKAPIIQDMESDKKIEERATATKTSTLPQKSTAINSRLTSTAAPAKGKAEDVVSGNGIILQPAGKDDIVLQCRILPCFKGTTGIIVEIDLPNHATTQGVTVDIVSPDKLVVHSSSQRPTIDGGKGYHAEIDLPNEPIDLDSVQAEFNRATRKLRVYTNKRCK
ncbi:hypothetical protein EDD11_007629 [Mortierella claussenii]|nr:hypothetical protein EDD11_007629 [Mortierella claussenii]